jgi:2-polyprenyl-6-methoxyphenol hydroxylase-like FAD-dependent oxidoreductase
MAGRYEIVIVGGGVGGSALATALAQAGLAVLVLEKSTVFPDLVRGEWMAPWGVVELRELGLYDQVLAAGGHQMNEFRPAADERRARVRERQIQDPSLLLPVMTTLLGPHNIPPETFEEATRQRLFAPA